MGNTHETEMARIEADLIGNKWRTSETYRWGYTKDRSPDTWWIYYPSASGGNQSPVDIPLEDVHVDLGLTDDPLSVSYASPPACPLAAPPGTPLGEEDEEAEGENESAGGGCLPGGGGRAAKAKQMLVNNGNTARLNITDSRSYISGGPLRDYTYVLEQVHVHWGETDAAGSEHLVNGRPHAAEVHLVHWNEALYESYEEAVKRDDGIAILAVFVKIEEGESNEGLTQFSKLIEDVAYRDQQVHLTEELDVKTLLPSDLNNYWSYRGSFTTPPCYETVRWILFTEPISTTSQILNKFRQLRTHCDNEPRPDDEFGGQILRNVRPVQPLGTRKIVTVDSSVEGKLRRATRSVDGPLLNDLAHTHAMPFPELFDQKRRDELFQWIK